MAAVTAPAALHFTGDPDADAFLVDNPLALTIGFVLDQQVTVQKAFSSPLELARRLGHLDAGAIAAMPQERLVDVFRTRPALHRFPGAMARRVQEHCAVVATEYGGDAASIWAGTSDAGELRRRLESLPGFGPMKVTALGSVLAKRLGVAAAAELVPSHPTLGDVDSPEALARYQQQKRAFKAAARRGEPVAAPAWPSS